MKSGILQHLARCVRCWAKSCRVFFAKTGGEYLKLLVLAAALFAWAYVAESKLIIGLESSQSVFERIP
jgi:hypothetical protein